MMMHLARKSLAPAQRNRLVGLLLPLLIAGSIVLPAPSAHAGIISASATGDATIGATPDASPVVNFDGFGGVYPGTAFLSSVTGLNGATLTFTTDGSYDYPPGNSDRLVLNVTNDTSAPLSFINFEVGNGASIYLFIANSYEVFPGSYSAGTIMATENVGDIATPSGFTHIFATPLAVGESEAFYIPLSLPSVPTTFTITESFTAPETSAVPEPATFALAALGGIGLAIGACRRRRREVALYRRHAPISTPQVDCGLNLNESLLPADSLQ